MRLAALMASSFGLGILAFLVELSLAASFDAQPGSLNGELLSQIALYGVLGAATTLIAHRYWLATPSLMIGGRSISICAIDGGASMSAFAPNCILPALGLSILGGPFVVILLGAYAAHWFVQRRAGSA
jgi:hypothetical protein